MHYLKKYLQRVSSVDLQPLFFNSNNPVKEVSESWAAFECFCRYEDPAKPSFNVHIGDGRYCRTGALFTFNSKSYNLSIDPIINEEYMTNWIEDRSVKRFNYSKKRIQDHHVIPGKANIFMVHSHANLKDVLEKVPNWNLLYINPCCMRDQQLLDMKYIDANNIQTLFFGVDRDLLSDKNEVIVYRKAS